MPRRPQYAYPYRRRVTLLRLSGSSLVWFRSSTDYSRDSISYSHNCHVSAALIHLLRVCCPCDGCPPVATWRYEFIATEQPHTAMLVLDGGSFKADDIAGARRVLASVIRNVRGSGPTKPNAIRLLDPLGQEAWRAKPQHR
jgi:hypothetical protein